MWKLPDRLPPSMVGILIVASFIIGMLSGYWMCKNQAKVNAAAVVLEDVLVSIGIRERHLANNRTIEERKNAPELKMLDDCYTHDLPFNFDAGVQSDIDNP